MLAKLCGEFSNVQTLLLILLKWMIDLGVTVAPKGDESKHFLSILTNMLATIELDSDVADSVSGYVSFFKLVYCFFLLVASVDRIKAPSYPLAY